MRPTDIERCIDEGPDLAVHVAIDTCIYERDGFRFDRGRLKHLEQFAVAPSTLLVPDVVYQEVLTHMVRRATSSNDALRKAVADAGETWQASETSRAAALQSVLGTVSAESMCEQRLSAFMARCAAVKVAAGDTVSVAALMRRYFAGEPPFEPSGTKKNEFPDAVALLSLEHWSRQHTKPVLVVSTDRGWQAFCDASDHLCCVTSLDDALALFQKRDRLQGQLLAAVVAQLDAARWKGLDHLRDLLADADWQADAFAEFDFDAVVQVGVDEVSFAGESAAVSLQAIDCVDGRLTVVAALVAEVTATAEFRFSQEGARLGSCRRSVDREVRFKALLTFELHEGAPLVLSGAELEQREMVVQFGDVDPDYSDENPYHEKY